LWKRGGIFFRIELGILSSPGALLLLRFLRQKSYVSWSKYVCRGVWGSPRLSIMYPSGHAMIIVGLHMCSVVGVYFGIGRWEL
jgi:hypothetical protein